MRLNWLDRAYLALAPRAGFERLRYRAAAEIALRATRGYDGAKKGGRNAGWIAAGTSANAEIAPGIATVRNRARDLVRNNFYGERAVRIYQATIVSTGVSAHANTGNKKADKKIDAAWRAWSEQCDAAGRHDFAGLQGLAIRATVEAGEMLMRLRPRKSDSGLHVPLQLELLEPDFIDTNRYETSAGGNVVLQGIEFDKDGQRVAYWLFDRHPGDVGLMGRGSFVSKRVPASDIVHLFRADRIGQVRGMSWFAPVITKMRDYDEYSEAELVRKKLAACFGAFVTTQDGPAASPLGAVSKDSAGKRFETLEPGLISYLKPGEEIAFAEPPGDVSLREYASISAHEIAAGLGTTYEDLTGDLSQVNYSSYRAGRLIHRRSVEQFQWTNFVPMFLAPTRRAFLLAGYLAGRFGAVEDATKWTFPKWESIDPVKDAAATRAQVRMGTKTWAQAVAEEGEDPEQQLEEIAAQNKKFDKAGVVLDCDPRKVTDKGQAQNPNSPDGAGADSTGGKTAE